MKRFKAIKRLKIENWLNNFLWVNIKTEKIKRLFHSRKLHNNGKNLYFSVSEVILVFHIAILREKPQLKYQRMVEINRKAFQIFQFLWSMIFFVFLSHQRGASWSSRRKPGLDWQQFIRCEKSLSTFQKLLTCAIITEQSLPWWWTEIIQYVVIQLIIVKFFLVQ